MRTLRRGLLLGLCVGAAAGCGPKYENKGFQSFSIELAGPVGGAADPFLLTTQYRVTVSYFEDAEGKVPYGNSLTSKPEGFEEFSPVFTHTYPGETKKFALTDAGDQVKLPRLNEHQSNFYVSAEILGRGAAGDTVARARCPLTEIKLDTGSLGPVVCHAFYGAVGKWSAVSPLNQPREQFAAARLLDGRVLVAGGLKPGAVLDESAVLSSVEIYDPNVAAGETAVWQTLPTSIPPRFGMTATIRADGKVLLAGGFYVRSRYPESGFVAAASNAALIFDPSTDSLTPVGGDLSPRAQHAAALLNGTTIILAGGVTDDDAPISHYYETLAGTGTTYASSKRSVEIGERRSPCMANVDTNKTILCSGDWNNGALAQSSSCLLITNDQVRAAGTSVTPRVETQCAVAGGTPFILGGEPTETTPRVEFWNAKSLTLDAWGKPPFSYLGQAVAATSNAVVVSGGTEDGDVPGPSKKTYVIHADGSRADPKLSGDLLVARTRHQMVSFPDDTVMAIGGSEDGTTELFVVPNAQ